MIPSPADYPIQVEEGVVLATLQVNLKIHEESGISDSVFSPRGFYYRHKKNFTEIETFDHSFAMKNGKGKLMGTNARERSGRALGRIKKKGRKFETIYDDSMPDIHKGQIIGYKRGWDVEIAEVDENDIVSEEVK